MNFQLKTHLILVIVAALFVNCAVASNYLDCAEKKGFTATTTETEKVDNRTIVIDGRKYSFFGGDVFNSDFFKKAVDEDNWQYLYEKPIIRDYFILIYPATVWLEDESLSILEIL